MDRENHYREISEVVKLLHPVATVQDRYYMRGQACPSFFLRGQGEAQVADNYHQC